MSRVKGLITIALVVVLLLNTGVALAKGPAGKVTGKVDLGAPMAGWSAQLNVHEAMNGRPAKGSMRTWDGVIERELLVKYVNVNGSMAWFAAQCTSDTSTTGNKKDWWLLVQVVDGGSPGRNGDEIGWEWYPDTDETLVEDKVSAYEGPADLWQVIKGNLKVH